jgi:hypothetical protein
MASNGVRGDAARYGASYRRMTREEELEDIAVSRARWRLRFYCWRWTIALALVSVQGGVLAWDVLSHHPAKLLIEVALPLR